MHRIHIVAISPRAGTTLLVEALRACFRVDASHAREEPLEVRSVGADVHLSKQPGDLMRIGPRLRLDPRFHAICMVRDPRDIVVSENWTRPDRYFVRSARVARDLRFLRRFQSHRRFTVVRYEELVSDPSGVQRILEQRMPFLVRTADFRDFHGAARGISEGNLADMHGLRPMDTASIGNWRNHLPRIADQRAALTPLLVALGYESDDAWERVLDGVAPVAQPPLRADQVARPAWLLSPLFRPLRRVWAWRRNVYAVRRRFLAPAFEGVRGLFEYLTCSSRG